MPDTTRRAARALLAVVILLLVLASPAAAAIAVRTLNGSSDRNAQSVAVVATRPRVSVSYAVQGLRVTASGVISRNGTAGVARLGRRVELEEETNAQSGAARWRVRASARLAPQAGRNSFAVRFKAAHAVGTVTLRVRVVSGSVVLTESSPKRVRLGPAVVVQSTLRSTTIKAPPGDVESVSGSPGATQTVVLARGSKVPNVGGALILGVSTRAPDGLLGVVTAVGHAASGSTTVTTRPATLEEAYSSFDAQIDGTLGELASEDASAAAHAAVNIGSFASVSFSCDDSGVQHSITHNIDLTEITVNSEIVIPSFSNGYSGPFINFDLGGHPKFGLGVTFSGSASCTADATANIPIADTGLFVEIGPQFKLSASGAVGVNLHWEPWINFGFSRGRGDPSNNYEAFHNDGHTEFSGDANLTLSLALKAGLNLAKRVGVTGTIGPEITGTVAATTATHAACLTVDAQVKAELTAQADVFFNDYNFKLGTFTFGHTQLYHACTGSGSGGGSGGGSSGGSGGGGGSVPPGGGGNPPRGLTPSESPFESGTDSDSSFGSHRCAALRDGTVSCWGDNFKGELGNGSDTDSSTPVQAQGITNATAVTTGLDDACALMAGGAVECWGENLFGELGDGTDTDSSTPVRVSGLTSATAVSAGGATSCALLRTGTVDCWGEGSYGELGNGKTINNPLPVEVSGIRGVTEIAVGSDFACALLDSGTVECWGGNKYGELGNGTHANSSTPDSVPGITAATRITAGGERACATLTDGTVDCWGEAGGYAVGDDTPSEVNTVKNAGEVSVDYGAICGVFTGGNIQCGSALIGGITNALTLSADQWGGCAVIANGDVDCWGGNFHGELGNGTLNNYYGAAVQVSGIDEAVSVATGEMFGCSEAEPDVECH